MRPKFAVYNDGVLWVCEQITVATDFGAVPNIRNKDDLRRINKFMFKEMSKRDQDMDFAESQGRTLSLKVRCMLHPGVKKTNMVLIEDTLYSIIHIDINRSKKQMFLYLEEERKL